MLNRNGQRIDLIITGQVDRKINVGIRKRREVIPKRCAKMARHQTINDKELATLRGCVVWDFLTSMLERQKTVTGFGWKPDQIIDIRDGGPSGDPYRKLSVEVIWKSDDNAISTNRERRPLGSAEQVLIDEWSRTRNDLNTEARLTRKELHDDLKRMREEFHGGNEQKLRRDQ